MKRPKLKQSLARFQEQQKKQKQLEHSQLAISNKGVPIKKHKVDERVIIHDWSDGQRSMLPLRNIRGNHILILGDGDFSYARSLITAAEGLSGEALICTVYEDEETLKERHPKAEENIRFLREAGALVMFSFDATKLSNRYLRGKLPDEMRDHIHISRIIFNFPHTGEGIKDRQHNIVAQQKLILAFLTAAADFLVEASQETKGGIEWIKRKTVVALPRTPQESTQLSHHDIDTYASLDFADDEYARKTLLQPEIHLTCWCGDPYDDWDVKGLALNTGKLALFESFAFDPSRYPDYEHCRTIGGSLDGPTSASSASTLTDAATFKKRPSRTYVFITKPKSK